MLNHNEIVYYDECKAAYECTNNLLQYKICYRDEITSRLHNRVSTDALNIVYNRNKAPLLFSPFLQAVYASDIEQAKDCLNFEDALGLEMAFMINLPTNNSDEKGYTIVQSMCCDTHENNRQILALLAKTACRFENGAKVFFRMFDDIENFDDAPNPVYYPDGIVTSLENVRCLESLINVMDELKNHEQCVDLGLEKISAKLVDKYTQKYLNSGIENTEEQIKQGACFIMKYGTEQHKKSLQKEFENDFFYPSKSLWSPVNIRKSDVAYLIEKERVSYIDTIVDVCQNEFQWDNEHIASIFTNIGKSGFSPLHLAMRYNNKTFTGVCTVLHKLIGEDKTQEAVQNIYNTKTGYLPNKFGTLLYDTIWENTDNNFFQYRLNQINYEWVNGGSYTELQNFMNEIRPYIRDWLDNNIPDGAGKFSIQDWKKLDEYINQDSLIVEGASVFLNNIAPVGTCYFNNEFVECVKNYHNSFSDMTKDDIANELVDYFKNNEMNFHWFSNIYYGPPTAINTVKERITSFIKEADEIFGQDIAPKVINVVLGSKTKSDRPSLSESMTYQDEGENEASQFYYKAMMNNLKARFKENPEKVDFYFENAIFPNMDAEICNIVCPPVNKQSEPEQPVMPIKKKGWRFRL